MRYTDTAVTQQDLGGTALNYSAGKYGDANGFRDACLAKCAGEEKCGGVVFQYYKTDKKTPKKCALKKLEPTTTTNKQKKKDFYRRVCYVGGPEGYLSPDDGSSIQLSYYCSKNVVELADGSVTVEGEPSVTEKLQSDLGTPWVPGKMTMNDSPCWCTTGKCLSYPAFEGHGTPSKSWIAGINRFTGQVDAEDGRQGKVRRKLSTYWYANNRVLPDIVKKGDQTTVLVGCA